MGAGSTETREPRCSRGAGGPGLPGTAVSFPTSSSLASQRPHYFAPRWLPLPCGIPTVDSKGPETPDALNAHLAQNLPPPRGSPGQPLPSAAPAEWRVYWKPRDKEAATGRSLVKTRPCFPRPCTPMPRGSPGAVLPSHTSPGAGVQWQQITQAKSWVIMPATVPRSGQSSTGIKPVHIRQSKAPCHQGRDLESNT